MRERRLEERAVVGFRLCRGEVVGLVDVVCEEACWALMAPALRSSRRRWPFESRGAIFEREEQVVIGSRGSEAKKAVGDGLSS